VSQDRPIVFEQIGFATGPDTTGADITGTWPTGSDPRRWRRTCPSSEVPCEQITFLNSGKYSPREHHDSLSAPSGEIDRQADIDLKVSIAA
jgi:hypothetical protein